MSRAIFRNASSSLLRVGVLPTRCSSSTAHKSFAPCRPLERESTSSIARMSRMRASSARSSARSTSRRVPSSAMSSSVRASVVHGMLSMTVTSAAVSVAPLWILMPGRRRAFAAGVVTSIQGRSERPSSSSAVDARWLATVPDLTGERCGHEPPALGQQDGGTTATTPRVQAVQPSLGNPIADRAGGQPERDDLADRDRAVLPRGEFADAAIEGVLPAFVLHEDEFAATPPWAAMLAGSNVTEQHARATTHARTCDETARHARTARRGRAVRCCGCCGLCD